MFTSPTKGTMSLDAMVEDIIDYVRQERSADYRLIIGTDSHTKKGTHMVTAVIIQRVGKGARFFYRHTDFRGLSSLRQKLYFETSISLEVVQTLKEKLLSRMIIGLRIEIHVDAGFVGPSRELIREIVGMVVATGLIAKVKPESFGAFAVADRFTK